MTYTTKDGIIENPMWNDLIGYLAGKNIDVTSGRIDYSYPNGAVAFQNNARYADEPVVVRHQIHHGFYFGSGAVARPHLHWLQQHSTNIPNWLFGYRLVENGDSATIETDFSNFTFSVPQSHVFTYSSGVLAQITKFTEIDISDLSPSDFIITVLFRDTTNASTLFSDVDPSSLVEYATDLDLHLKIDALGSREEYTK